MYSCLIQVCILNIVTRIRAQFISVINYIYIKFVYIDS